MSTATVVNDNTTAKTPLNKIIGFGMIVFAVIEAVLAYFIVLGPLFVSPIYATCERYNAAGTTCIVKLFGKTFASAEEIANNQIILSLWDTIVNVALIYLIITGMLLLLSFCFIKGFAFAKSYLIAVFGAKALIGLSAILVPFANTGMTMKVFGVADAVLCIIACIYFVYLDSIEYADEMLLEDAQIAAMKKRGISGGILCLLTTVFAVLESFAVNAMNGHWSYYLGWLPDASGAGTTELAEGACLAIIVAAAFIGAITHIRESNWSVYFYFAVGVAGALSNLVGIINRFTGVTYYYTSIGTITMIAAFVVAALLAVMSFAQIKGIFKLKVSADDKKPATAVLIGVAAIALSFILTMVGVLMWDKILYGTLSFGAMDYITFVVYGAISIFLIAALLGGYSFTKFGTLALFLIVAANNFSSIFTVFSARSAMVQAQLAQGMSYVGYNYIISGVMFILSLVCCLGLIALFAVKGVDDLLYERRFEQTK